MEGDLSVDDEQTQLDDAIDAFFADDAAAAAPEAAADAEPADGQDAADAAAEDDDDAAAAEEDADEAEADDELSQLRARLEAVEAERARELADRQARDRQADAARAETELATREQQWDAYFQQWEERAWADAQQTYNPLEAYRQAMAQIVAARDQKKQEFARYRTVRVETALALSRLPDYAAYVSDHFGLTGAEAAHVKKLATTPGVNPDSLPALAQTLKELAAAKAQEHRAAKAATLKKTSGKPGGGSPHKPKADDIDAYIDQMFG